MKTPIRFVDDLIESQAPGHAKYVADATGAIVGINFWCPKCLNMGAVRFPPWTWNGDRERPTVRASILHDRKSCGWHAFLTDGEFVEC